MIGFIIGKIQKIDPKKKIVICDSGVDFFDESKQEIIRSIIEKKNFQSFNFNFQFNLKNLK